METMVTCSTRVAWGRLRRKNITKMMNKYAILLALISIDINMKNKSKIKRNRTEKIKYMLIMRSPIPMRLIVTTIKELMIIMKQQMRNKN